MHWQMRAEAVVALGRLPHRKPFAEANAANRDAIERAMALTDSLPATACSTACRSAHAGAAGARAGGRSSDPAAADEPLAGLDPLHQLEAMTLLRETARGGAGVVVVLHDLTLAGRFCDRLVLLDRGRLADDRPAEVLADGPIGRAFGIVAARAVSMTVRISCCPGGRLARRRLHDNSRYQEFHSRRFAARYDPMEPRHLRRHRRIHA